MPRKSSRAANGASFNVPLTLTERVRERVAKASRKLNRSGEKPSAVNDHRQTDSLVHVYKELRTRYRLHRQTTGQPAVPALRQAVVEFKRDPNLTSLVSVATFLDDRKLLSW